MERTPQVLQHCNPHNSRENAMNFNATAVHLGTAVNFSYGVCSGDLWDPIASPHAFTEPAESSLEEDPSL